MLYFSLLHLYGTNVMTGRQDAGNVNHNPERM